MLFVFLMSEDTRVFLGAQMLDRTTRTLALVKLHTRHITPQAHNIDFTPHPQAPWHKPSKPHADPQEEKLHASSDKKEACGRGDRSTFDSDESHEELQCWDGSDGAS